MRAIQVTRFAPQDNLQLASVAEPTPADDGVVISAHYTALNFPDLLLIEGNYQFKPELPFVPGRDVAGTVLAVGKQVENLLVGDRVAGQTEYGALSEQVHCPAAQCFKLPDDMDMQDAAALGLAYQTAYFALVQRARYQTGESVLVLGAAGSVGLAAVQLAKALGARVIAAVRTSEQAALALEHGADHAVDLAAADLKSSLRDQLYEVNDGKGVDIVIDPLGGDAFTAALRCLAWQGRLVVVGFAAGAIPEMRVNYLLLRNIEVSGLQWTGYRDFTPAAMRRAQEHIHELYLAGVLARPRIASVYPLSGYASAFDHLRSGNTGGKVLVDLRTC